MSSKAELYPANLSRACCGARRSNAYAAPSSAAMVKSCGCYGLNADAFTRPTVRNCSAVAPILRSKISVKVASQRLIICG